MDCREKYPTLCQVSNQLHPSSLHQVERAPQFLLRGLPPSVWIDQLYSLNEDLHNGRRQFVGPSGWMIRWDGARWVLECQRWNRFASLATSLVRFSNSKAEAETSDYPVGSLTWKVQDRNASFYRLLTLTACSGNPLVKVKGNVFVRRT